MTRVFLVIASSEYKDVEHLPVLHGVIIDGQNIKEVLLEPSFGEYDSSLSRLLVSPTLLEVQNAIDEILFDTDKIDCFTLYFAGHGISHQGTYYLCIKDTFVNKLSTTALPINHIFNIINDVLPIQTNIIIDSCEAGGVASDLATLIKPDVFGSASSPSVSLFGACMRDQTAEEDQSKGGIATQELLKYLSGEICVDNRWPFLDLVQIGRNVSFNLKDKGFEQTPVVWGLSLSGVSSFSKNPHFNSNNNTENHSVDIHTFISSDYDLLQDEKEKIWLHYIEVIRNGASPELLSSILHTVKALKDKGMDVAKIGAFLLGTSESFSMRVAENNDLFSELEIMATFGAAFLPILEDKSVEQSFLVLLDRISNLTSRVFKSLESDLNEEQNALISTQSGLSDLYYLPIRITKILGWIGLAAKLEKCVDINQIIPNKTVLNILEKLAENYLLSFSCVSDFQAPYLMVYSQLEGLISKDDNFILPIRTYINDFFIRKGKVTNHDISGRDVLDYLIARTNNNYSNVLKSISQPSELLAVLFDAAVITELNDEIDPFMIELDHFSLNIYLVENAETFADEIIDNGINITMQIGSEVGRGIFTLEDYSNIYKDECVSRIQEFRGNVGNEIHVAMIFASFINPNRVPWATRTIHEVAT